MAVDTTPKEFTRLTDDAKDHLKAMENEIEVVEKDMAALESIGLNVDQLRDKVLWAKKARKVILDRLG